MLVKFLDENGEVVTASPDNPVPTAGSTGGDSSSMRFLSGTNDPDASTGEPGDVYLNTSSGDMFKNDNGTWNLMMNIVGPEGPQGEQGPPGDDGALAGVTVPTTDPADGVSIWNDNGSLKVASSA